MSDSNWEGSSIETPTTPIIDQGKGEEFVIRYFEFKMNPDRLGKPVSKQELFDAHAKQMQTMLWEDGLVPVSEVDPRVTVQDDLYRIFITCRSRVQLGVTAQLGDKPIKIHELLKPNDLTK